MFNLCGACLCDILLHRCISDYKRRQGRTCWCCSCNVSCQSFVAIVFVLSTTSRRNVLTLSLSAASCFDDFRYRFACVKQYYTSIAQIALLRIFNQSLIVLQSVRRQSACTSLCDYYLLACLPNARTGRRFRSLRPLRREINAGGKKATIFVNFSLFFAFSSPWNGCVTFIRLQAFFHRVVFSARMRICKVFCCHKQPDNFLLKPVEVKLLYFRIPRSIEANDALTRLGNR